MVNVELETQEKKPVEKVFLERTSTIGKVVSVGSWKGTKDKDKKDASGKVIGKETVPTEKIFLNVKVGDKEVQCWMNADIKKGTTAAYNTLSYTNLENLGLVDAFKEAVEAAKRNNAAIDLHFVELFFKNKLVDREIKFVPETINPKSGSKYSIIKTIEGFGEGVKA